MWQWGDMGREGICGQKILTVGMQNLLISSWLYSLYGYNLDVGRITEVPWFVLKEKQLDSASESKTSRYWVEDWEL